MNIQDIQQLIDKYSMAYRQAQEEAYNCKVLLEHWKSQKELLEQGDNPTDKDLFRQMYGPDATPTVPKVNYTYTDTPMAEEYYGG